MSEMGLLGPLASAFLGGLLLNLMPCVFPVLAIKITSLTQQARNTRSEVRLAGLAYTAGVVLSLLLLAGLLFSLREGGARLGWGFQLQSPYFMVALVLLFTLVAFNFLGLFEVGIPARFLPTALTAREGLAGEFFSGVLTVLIASPCSAPFMATAIGYALMQDFQTTVLVFFMMGLGLASPFFLLTFVPSAVSLLPRPGVWMTRLKEFMAFPMFATVIWLMWILSKQVSELSFLLVVTALLVLSVFIWLRQQSFKKRFHHVLWPAVSLLGCGSLLYFAFANPPSTASVQLGGLPQPEGVESSVSSESAEETEAINWKTYEPQAVTATQKEGKVVFVDFTADWCVSCKVNEKVVFGSDRVLEELSCRDVALFKADWTNEDPVVTAALERFDRVSVPLYLMYKPGVEEPEILPQVLTPDIFLAALDRASDAETPCL